LAQIAAEELDVAFEKVRMVGADTSRGPDEQYTFGSQSVEQSGSAIGAACAEARGILVAGGGAAFSPSVRKICRSGLATSPLRTASHAKLLGSRERRTRSVRGDIAAATAPKKPGNYSIVGKSANRIDLPGKLTGAPSYVQDMRLPGMVFARVVRPPRYGAKLVSFDEAAVRSLSGVVAVVRDGNFLAVAAKREEQAIAARNVLTSSARWSDDSVPLPDMADLRGELQRLRAETTVVGTAGQSRAGACQAKRVTAEYLRSYLSHDRSPFLCRRMAERRPHDVWSHTRCVSLRGDLAKVLAMRMRRSMSFICPEPDAMAKRGRRMALDAALVARAVAGAPVKLQWMRDDEFTWAPFGPAMAMRIEAALTSDGKIADWSYDVWSNSHAMRPGKPAASIFSPPSSEFV